MLTTIGDSHAFERPVELDVNIDLAVIGVEMQERPGAAREVAALALAQLRKTARRHKQRLYAIKVFVMCMAHLSYPLSYRHSWIAALLAVTPSVTDAAPPSSRTATH